MTGDLLTEREQLADLPVGTVVREQGNYPYATVYERCYDGWYGRGLIDEPATPELPVTILYTPENLR